MLGRGGIGGLLLVAALLYFTPLGSKMMANLQNMGTGCYSSLGQVSSRIAGPVCDAVTKGVQAMDDFASNIKAKIDGVTSRLEGNGIYANLHQMAEVAGEHVSGFASSSDRLADMVQLGPGHGSGSAFQQAIDNFTIGQNYLNSGGSLTQALPWLQQGAQQPQGYGVLSQISLGNLYASGGNGVAPNPQLATYYLSQAQGSINALSGNKAPQAQQLLQALPASPQQTQASLQQMIQQLSMVQK